MDSIKILKWDSSFFGYKVGLLEIENVEDFNYNIFFEQAKQFRLVYIYSNNKIKNNQLTLVDEKMTFWKLINPGVVKKEESANPSISSFEPGYNNLEQLKELTLLSGIYSRFYVDPNFVNQEYQSLYLEWINKSIEKILAFDTLIYSIQEKIAGFITISKKTQILADIGLLAVDSSFRGQGVASQLINAAIVAALTEGFTEMQVVTQSKNYPAISLYTKANFEITGITNIYHYWNL